MVVIVVWVHVPEWAGPACQCVCSFQNVAFSKNFVIRTILTVKCMGLACTVSVNVLVVLRLLLFAWLYWLDA